MSCEFCDKKNLFVGIPNWNFKEKKTDCAVGITKIVDKMNLVFTNSADNNGYGVIEITFCPICGRKLDVDND